MSRDSNRNFVKLWLDKVISNREVEDALEEVTPSTSNAAQSLELGESKIPSNVAKTLEEPTPCTSNVAKTLEESIPSTSNAREPMKETTFASTSIHPQPNNLQDSESLISIDSPAQSATQSYISTSKFSGGSFSRMSLESMTKLKVPRVLRASGVDSKLQIIPPLPRLCLNDNMADKLSRVLSKFDAMTMEEEEEINLPSTSFAPPANKAKYD